MINFHGVKVALFAGDKLIVSQRDYNPAIRWRGLWDFPGGARDGNESPTECAVREIREELGIELNPSSIYWQKDYPGQQHPDRTHYFMAARITPDQVRSIKFGDEGLGWKLTTVEDYLADRRGIAYLKNRLRDYLAAQHITP